MELAGLEPATSLGAMRSPALNLACLQGFRGGAARPEAHIVRQLPPIPAGIGPKKRVFGPIFRLGRLRVPSWPPSLQELRQCHSVAGWVLSRRITMKMLGNRMNSMP